MNCCTSRCGYCGRCDDGLMESPEPTPYPFCDECGRDCLRALSLAGVGVACSRICLDKLAATHEAPMHKRTA